MQDGKQNAHPYCTVHFNLPPRSSSWPIVTFSSPLHKDKTVYAVAGSHTKTLLQLAKENHIPIDFSCDDGECGTCLVKVTNVTRKGPMGGPLTDREITVLKDLGKITQDQIEAMKVDDYRPHVLAPGLPDGRPRRGHRGGISEQMSAAHAMPSPVADRTGLYGLLMARAGGLPNDDLFARMLFSQTVGMGALPPGLGLAPAEFAALMARHFPDFVLPAYLAAPALESERHDERDELLTLLQRALRRGG